MKLALTISHMFVRQQVLRLVAPMCSWPILWRVSHLQSDGAAIMRWLMDDWCRLMLLDWSRQAYPIPGTANYRWGYYPCENIEFAICNLQTRQDPPHELCWSFATIYELPAVNIANYETINAAHILSRTIEVCNQDPTVSCDWRIVDYISTTSKKRNTS